MNKQQKASVIGIPDPNFKKDPREKQVYDEKKGVYRTVKVNEEKMH